MMHLRVGYHVRSILGEFIGAYKKALKQSKLRVALAFLLGPILFPYFLSLQLLEESSYRIDGGDLLEVGIREPDPDIWKKTERVTLIDCNNTKVARMKDYLDENRIKNVKVVQADLRDMPFSDESFDVLRCVRILCCYGEKDILRAVSEIVRVLKRDGRAIICTRISCPKAITSGFSDDIVKKIFVDLGCKIMSKSLPGRMVIEAKK